MTSNFAGVSFGYDADKIFKERDETMCESWKCTNSEFRDCTISAKHNPVGNFIINGTVKGLIGAEHVKFWASAQPTYTTGLAGSGLPYPNEYEAFQNTPNQGVVKIHNRHFSFPLNYPNSYYTNMGRKYVNPQVKFQFCDGRGNKIGNVQVLDLGNGIPFRSLTFSKKRDMNNGPMWFCNNNLPVRSQEQILRDSGYPSTNTEPINFWGTMPPH